MQASVVSSNKVVPINNAGPVSDDDRMSAQDNQLQMVQVQDAQEWNAHEVEAELFRAQEPRSLSIHSFLVFRTSYEPLKCAPLLPREFWYIICFS